ncbi:glucan endo-1,3-beta-glucosidase-like [Tasmannia lanceolata]|uniref:glucan endo-1,3-beta-glucosidase-like n=1 Tax=Tasmannia lanceolata TaxID=3420 RepID=UPI004063B241
MATLSITSGNLMVSIMFLIGLLMPTLQIAGVQSIGVCYGNNGNNLPSAPEVIDLYKSRNIGGMRLYYANQAALQALRGSTIQVILDVPSDRLQEFAVNPSTVNLWVQTNIRNYPDVKFQYIAVGNEVIPGGLAQYVLPAMQNVHSALVSAGLQGQIKVSTSVATGVLGNSFPPSQGSFSDDALTYLPAIIQFLVSNGSPLLANVYPYFSYVDNPSSISLQYALFTSLSTVVNDGQFQYQNLFDAILDAVYAALEKVGGSNLEIVVSESGWPSAGGTAATIDNAQTYNTNLIGHVARGTPRRSGRAIETYVFAMFNENQKSAGIEQNFGLFYPNKQPVYQINFT